VLYVGLLPVNIAQFGSSVRVEKEKEKEKERYYVARWTYSRGD
jgi:hypothetical protein